MPIPMRDRILTTILETRPLSPDSHIVTDAIVQVGGAFRSMKEPLRLVEFYDEKGRHYRLLTS